MTNESREAFKNAKIRTQQEEMQVAELLSVLCIPDPCISEATCRALKIHKAISCLFSEFLNIVDDVRDLTIEQEDEVLVPFTALDEKMWEQISLMMFGTNTDRRKIEL